MFDETTDVRKRYTLNIFVVICSNDQIEAPKLVKTIQLQKKI